MYYGTLYHGTTYCATWILVWCGIASAAFIAGFMLCALFTMGRISELQEKRFDSAKEKDDDCGT
jgi:hypothetical protein